MSDQALAPTTAHVVPAEAARRVRRLLAGVSRRDPTICWTDLLGSAALGYGALLVGADLGRPTPWRVVAFVVAVLALHRAIAFMHEITHLGRGELPGFKLAWNVLVGVPLCLPSFLAEGAHAQHHRLASYGTAADPEYLPSGCDGRGARLVLAASGAVVPLLFLARFLVAPLAAVVPALRHRLDTRCSALAFNPRYRRPPLPLRLRREAAIAEAVTSVWAISVTILVAIGPVPLAAVAYVLAVLSVVGLLNQVRAAWFAHHFAIGDRPASLEAVLADTRTLGGPAILAELLAPLGARYHALHHLAPWVPYHALGSAHRRVLHALSRPDATERRASAFERVAWVAAVAGWHSVYHLIPTVVDAGAAVRLTTAADRAIPTLPAWMFAYAAIYPIVLVPPLVLRDLSLVRRLGAAHLSTQTIAFAAFLAVPVTSVGLRPEVVSTDTFAGWALAVNYRIDAPLNCFPSLHVATTTLTALALLRVSRTLGLFAGAVAVAIALSTLLVKQHYVADVVAGAALGASAAWMWLGRGAGARRSPDEARVGRVGLCGFAVLYGALLLGGAAAYGADRPSPVTSMGTGDR